MNLNRGLKIYLVLLISTVYLISFSQMGVKAYDAFLSKGTFEPGTLIGSVNIENMTKEQAVDELNQQVSTWFQGEYLQLSINEENTVIDQDFFNLDFPATVDSITSGESNNLIVSVNQNVYEEQLKTLLNERYETIDHEQLQAVILDAVRKMQTENQFFSIDAYVKSDLNTVAAENFISTSFDYAMVQKVVDSIGTIIVPAQSQVSLLELTKKSENLPQEGLNVVSSALYKTFLSSNFVIVERHTGHELPGTIELGYEANIIKDKSDLKWYNPNQSEYTISLELTNAGLFVRINGAPFLYSYKINLEEKTSYKPKSIIRYTSLLEEGQEKVIQEGKDGLSVKITREVFDLEGALVDSEEIAEDFYPPTHKIIETGLINRLLNNQSTNEVITEETENAEQETTVNEASSEEDNENSDTAEDEVKPDSEGIWETPSKNAIEK
ncbi:G5 domain-containing protein [Metabacillus endolithicus]|uniref:G5 domain-containing protein n=1 Tax=Metabacillus endolithicus TaxID=1535204 RepID=A0ABW5BW40_9BACI|nr:G5 domain-containing protein [Metabacillus endolithicus]UPG64702.1 G5 domain-containing protein [Metabacillus endolithicus]